MWLASSIFSVSSRAAIRSAPEPMMIRRAEPPRSAAISAAWARIATPASSSERTAPVSGRAASARPAVNGDV